MEVQVVIVSCKNCIFTQNAESIVLNALDLINKGDVGNISLRVTSIDLRELCHSSVAVTVRKAKVQIVIITYSFLDELKNSVQKNFCQIHLNRVLQSKGVICVLMRINYEEILRNYSRLLPHFMDWNVLELRANKRLDQNFSKTFQEAVIQSYNGRAKHYESRIPQPLLGTAFQMQTRRSGDPGNPSDKPLLLSTRSDEGAETITVKLNEAVGPSDELRIQLRKGDDVYSTVVQIPDNLSPSSSHGSIVQIEAPFLVVSNLFPNKDDPIDQMLITFPGYKQYLDDHLSLAIEHTFSVGSGMEQLTLLQEFLNGRENLFPTVLHFAAYYGLEKTVVVLMASDLGLNSLGETNEHGETPLEIAKRRRHDATIGEIFREFEDPIIAWEAIKFVNPCKSPHSFKRKCSKELSVSASVDDPVFSDPAESARASEMEEEVTPDLESPLEQHYTNIELVPPDLPDRRRSGFRGTYCFPTTEMNYCVPPPPREAMPSILQRIDGTIKRLPDNYIDVMGERYNPGDTLKHINRNFIRTDIVSVSSTTDDEEELPVYNRPVPLPPTPPVVTDQIVKATPSNVDPRHTELVESIKQAVAKGLSWEEVAEQVKSIHDTPGKKAMDEREEKILEEMREEYRQRQIAAKRETNGTGILDRVVQGIKKATKKISSAGLNLKSNEELSGDDKQGQLFLSTAGAGDRRSSSLTSLLEEGMGSDETARRQNTKTRKKRDVALTLDVTLPMNSETEIVSLRTKSRIMMSNSGELFVGESGLKDRAEGSAVTISPPPGVKNAVESSFANILHSKPGYESEIEAPPPRPPKKMPIKMEPPVLLSYANRTPPNLPTGAGELSDAERRMLIPPKPARRHNVTDKVNYINYQDPEQTQQPKQN